MPSVSSEIIAEITDHIRKFGGDFTAWCVGTARDWHSPILVAHQIEEKHDALICRGWRIHRALCDVCGRREITAILR
jgi:hypothetical protein